MPTENSYREVTHSLEVTGQSFAEKMISSSEEKARARSSTSDAERPIGALTAGMELGRFRILYALGAGGMGEVYAAVDIELGRKVAVKVLRPDLHGDVTDPDTKYQAASSQLLVEARALAQLQHESVVPVFDVGRARGVVFVAMELLDGSTLGDWLRQKKRSWIECVRACVRAGRGLAAAHRVGIVHRDVKPQNIMVCRDGRVCMLDFGLATPKDEAQSSTQLHLWSASTVVEGQLENTLAASLTSGTGLFGGTPSYMSPEQHRHEWTDARSDQFSFAVTLYEALSGQRPFRGNGVLAIAEAITSGRRADAQWPSSIPSPIRKMIDRGLALHPQDRYASLGDMLDELETVVNDYVRRWPLRIYRASFVFTAAVFCMIVSQATVFEDRCSQAGSDVAAVWTPLREDAIRQSFQILAATRGVSLAQEFSEKMSAWVDTWRDAAQRNCSATHIQGIQSGEDMDVKNECLAEQLSTVSSILGELDRPDEAVLEHLSTTIRSLPRTQECEDLRTLRARRVRPPHPSIAMQVESLESRLQEVRSAVATSRTNESLRRCDKLLPELGDISYPPIQIRVKLGCATAYAETPRVREAGPLAYAAFNGATSADLQYDAAEAAGLLVYLYGYRLGEPDYAVDQLLPLAMAARSRLPVRDPMIDRSVTNAGAIAMAMANRSVGAARLFKESLEAAYEAFGTAHVDTVMAENNLGVILLTQFGENQRARQHFLRGLKISRQVSGEYHPSEVLLRANLISIARFSGDLDLGVEMLAPEYFAATKAELSPQTWGFYWIQAMAYDIHRGQLTRAARRLDEFVAWLHEYWPDAAHLMRDVKSWQAQLAIQRGRIAENYRDMLNNRESLLESSQAVTIARDARADLSAMLASTCLQKEETARQIYREYTLSELRLGNGEVELAYELYAWNAAVATYLGHVEFVERGLTEFRAALEDTKRNRESRFGMTAAAQQWAVVAARHQRWSLAQQWLSFTKEVLNEQLAPDDPQWIGYWEAVAELASMRGDRSEFTRAKNQALEIYRLRRDPDLPDESARLLTAIESFYEHPVPLCLQFPKM